MLKLSDELRQRWIYALGAAVLVTLTLFVLGQEASFLLSLICGLLGWREYARMMGLNERPSLHWSGYAFVPLMFLHSFFVGPRTLLWIWAAWAAAFLTLFVESWIASRRDRRALEEIDIQKAWSQLCRFVMGLLYIFLLFGFIGSIVSGPRGEQMVFLTFAIVFGGDSTAYFVGRRLGRRKLWPALSPKKTVEGALGGYAGSMVFGMVFWFLFSKLMRHPVPISTVLWMSLLLPPLAQAGDFLESLMKRAAGRKNSGGLLPGHGGILDRADGLAFAMPLVYFLFS